MYALRILKPICNRDQHYNIYTCLIRSLLEYGSSVFVDLPVGLLTTINLFLRRCHRLIHTPDCTCPFDNYKSRINYLAVKLFNGAASNNNHPLHSLIPNRNPRTGKYQVEHSPSNRRQSTFHIYTTLLCNNDTY